MPGTPPAAEQGYELGGLGPLEDLIRAVEPEQMIWQKGDSRPSSMASVLQGRKVLEGDKQKPLAYSLESW